MRLIQVVLTSTATPVTTNTNIYCSALTIQNNAAAVVRVGDNTVSATKGISLAAAGVGSTNLTFAFPRGTHLSDWFLFGTAAQVIDILYESAE